MSARTTAPVLALLALLTPLAAAPPLRVGAAVADITPPVGYRHAGGYDEVLSTGVHDPLRVRALVLSQGDVTIVLAIADLLSVPEPLSSRCRQLASERTGVPIETIVIAATHNHGSPEHEGPLRDVFHSAAITRHGRDPHETLDYGALLVERVVDAIERAHASARPASLELFVGEALDLAFNRRFHLRDGSVRFNPGKGNPEIVRPAGPVDPELPFLLARSETDGSPIATLATFAMHTASFGGTEFGADFPGHLERLLREHHAEDALVALFAEGTAGDINHIDVSDPRPQPADSEPQRIARELFAAISSAEPLARTLSPSLAARSSTPSWPLREVTPERAAEALAVLGTRPEERPAFLEVVAAWRDVHAHRLRERHGPRKPLEVQAFRLDERSAIVTLPHEIFVEIGMAIEAASPFPTTIVISLANDVDFYIPTRRAFAEGSYEVTTCPLEPGCGELLVDTARALLLELATAPPPGPGTRVAARPLTPRVARASLFTASSDLEVELVAAEPDVIDPVAMAFDEHGRLFVVENRGYPDGLASGALAGVIALLEDPDGDGRYERRSDFARELSFPNGVLPWRGGIFVTCAPDVLWLTDLDDDGQADERRVVLTGFDASNTTQLRVSHPTLGLDGKIYLTSGLTGAGLVSSPAHPAVAPLRLQSDSRFDRFTGVIEALDGRGQFGLTFDGFGRRFTCMNRVHVQHPVIASRDLARHPRLAFSETVENCPETLVDDLLVGVNRAAQIWPISGNVTTADSHVGTFSAACGVHVYQGDGLPEQYRGAIFACDPTGNLVHRDELLEHGATFRARPVDGRREFLASTDDWFRPVNLAEGPDGALHVVDMYRRTIEHPRYLPPAVRARTDFASGREHGRIWRVRAAQDRPARRESRGGADGETAAAPTVDTLVTQLTSANGWARETAHRLLLERRDPASGDPLRALARDTTSAVASARARALRLLESLDELDEPTLLAALEDPAAGVRENAVEILRERASGASRSIERRLSLVDDPSPRVRFLVALALGDSRNAAVPAALARIALEGAGDRWTRAAVLSATADREVPVLVALLESVASDASRTESELAGGLDALALDLARLATQGAPVDRLPATFAAILEAAERVNPLQRVAIAGGLARGVALRTGVDATTLESVLRALSSRELAVWSDARERAPGAIRAQDASAATRIAALALLATDDRGRETLLDVIATNPAVEITRAALETLGRSPASLASGLLDASRWPRYSAVTRSLVVATLTSRAELAARLLDELEADRVPLNAIDASQRGRLLAHPDAATRARAEALLASPGSRDRQAVFESHRVVLSLEGDPKRGREHFVTACAPCHRLDGEGNAVGPDLFGVRGREKEVILFHVLVPDAEIVPGFEAIELVTRDGRVLVGVVTSENDTALTLVGAQGVESRLARESIATRRVSTRSLMPDGIEATLDQQALADLLAFVKGE